MKRSVIVKGETFECRNGMYFGLVDFILDNGQDLTLRAKIDINADAAEIVSADMGALTLDRYALVKAVGDAELDRVEEGLAEKLGTPAPVDNWKAEETRAFNNSIGHF